MIRRTARALRHQHLGRALAALLGLALLAGCASTGASTGATSPAPSISPSASSTETTPVAPSPSTSEAPGPNVIAKPTDGESVTGPTVTVTGRGTAFEATLVWEATDAATHESIKTGSTMAGANGAIGPFSFTVNLDPGDYVLEIWEPDVSDEAADPHHNSVSVTFTVT